MDLNHLNITELNCLRVQTERQKTNAEKLLNDVAFEINKREQNGMS
jgi:hypothetical protein